MLEDQFKSLNFIIGYIRCLPSTVNSYLMKIQFFERKAQKFLKVANWKVGKIWFICKNEQKLPLENQALILFKDCGIVPITKC